MFLGASTEATEEGIPGVLRIFVSFTIVVVIKHELGQNKNESEP